MADIFDVALTPATPPEAELLEWLNGVHAERFTIVVDRSGATGEHRSVKLADAITKTLSGGSGATFAEASSRLAPWPELPLEEVPETFSVIKGGRDRERS